MTAQLCYIRQTAGRRTAVDQHIAPTWGLEQDAIPAADIQQGHMQPAVRCSKDRPPNKHSHQPQHKQHDRGRFGDVDQIDIAETATVEQRDVKADAQGRYRLR